MITDNYTTCFIVLSAHSCHPFVIAFHFVVATGSKCVDNLFFRMRSNVLGCSVAFVRTLKLSVEGGQRGGKTCCTAVNVAYQLQDVLHFALHFQEKQTNFLFLSWSLNYQHSPVSLAILTDIWQMWNLGAVRIF